VDAAAGTFSITLDLGGNVFGGPDPDPETLSGSFTPGEDASFEVESETFGTTTVTIDGRHRRGHADDDQEVGRLPRRGV